MRTHTRLLDASIECLAEHGYTGATMQLIADRAGVSRGAQAYHFASKAQLVQATIRHLAALHAVATRRVLHGLDPLADPAETLLRLAAELCHSSLPAATMELMLAARTDRALVLEMTRLERAMTVDLVTALSGDAPGRTTDRGFREFVAIALSLIQGALIANLIDRDAIGARRRWQQVAVSVRSAYAQLASDPQPPTVPLI